MRYLVDSNCFIEPHRGVCAIDVAISFWTKVKELGAAGSVFVLDAVKREISEVEDELNRWLKENMSGCFKHFGRGDDVEMFKTVSRWVQNNIQYQQTAKDKFLDDSRADIYLVSFAAVNPDEWTVVSQEKSSPKKQTEIKLPDVCRSFGVKCINLMDMFRELEETF